MNDKHAYLIMAHNQFELLKILIKSLDFYKNDIFLHIDEKAGTIDYEQFYKCVKESKLYILNKRLNVMWGTYSQIKCEMLLLEYAFKNDYKYYHLISGVDMPLKKQKEIYAFFEENYGKEFIHFEKEIIDKDAYWRMAKFHIFTGKNQNFLKKIINKFFIKFQIGVDRVKKNNLKIQKGSNWFSITDKLARYIIENKKFIEKNFKYTRCTDEMFIQTIVQNSTFLKNITENNFCDNYENIMYCIDWKRGNPYEFKTEDFELLVNSNMLFARKFNWNKDKEIIEKLYNHVKNDC